MLTNLFSFPNFERSKVTVWYNKRYSITAFSNHAKEVGFKLIETHAPVVEFYSDNHKHLNLCEQVFAWMQGEIWSPNGEARSLIESIEGVQHTSMMVSDIVQIDKKIFVCAAYGFVEVGSLEGDVFVPKDEES